MDVLFEGGMLYAKETWAGIIMGAWPIFEAGTKVVEMEALCSRVVHVWT